MLANTGLKCKWLIMRWDPWHVTGKVSLDIVLHYRFIAINLYVSDSETPTCALEENSATVMANT